MMNRVRALPVAWTKTGRASWCTSVPSREPPTSTRPSLRPYACPSLHMSKSKQQPVGVSLVAGVIAGAVEGLATYPTVRHTLDRTKRALVSYVAKAMKLELKRTLHPFTTGLCQNPSPVRIFNSRSKGSPATCSQSARVCEAHICAFLQPPGLGSIIQSTIRKKGVLGLYTGCGALIAGNSLKAGVRFLGYDSFKGALQDYQVSDTHTLI